MDKVIICDIDSTINDHWLRIRRNTIPMWPNGKIDEKAFSKDEVLKDNILPMCRCVLTRLQHEGFYIRYLTARGWMHARHITYVQLDNWDLPNSQDIILCENIKQKVEILSSNICWCYIDDFTTGQESSIPTFHKEVALQIQNKGIRVIAFRNDWNDVYNQIKIYENIDKNV